MVAEGAFSEALSNMGIVISGLLKPITHPLEGLSQLPCQPRPVVESNKVVLAKVHLVFGLALPAELKLQLPPLLHAGIGSLMSR